MNYDTPASRFGEIGVTVIPRDFEPPMLYRAVEAIDESTDEDIFNNLSVTDFSPESYDKDEVVNAIKSAAKKDVEMGDAAIYLQPEFAVRRALEVYDLYVSDTSYPAEMAIADYLYIFTETLLDPESQAVDDEALERLYAGITKLLSDFDNSAEAVAA